MILFYLSCFQIIVPEKKLLLDCVIHHDVPSLEEPIFSSHLWILSCNYGLFSKITRKIHLWFSLNDHLHFVQIFCSSSTTKKIANDAVRILATLHNNIRALCSMCKSFTFLVPCFGNTGMVTANYAFQLWLGSLKRGWSLSTPSLLFLGLFLQLLV